MNVICVKWGDKYGSDYVERLSRGVMRNLPIEHDFICMTDKPVRGFNCIPLASDLPSWWSKLAIFKPGLFTGECLYLDLDVIITDSLLPLVALLYQSPGLWVRDDFSYSIHRQRPDLSAEFKLMLGGEGTVNSSVMLWREDAARAVWEEFDPASMKVLHGDQNWISKLLWPRGGIQLIPDDLVCSYKYHVMRNLPVAPVVVFHGDPKPADLSRHDPLRQLWER